MSNIIIIRVADLRKGDQGFNSRAKAKELTRHLSDRDGFFALSFEGIDTISPSFADEVFRVFPATRPDVELVAMNTTEDVDKMIRDANPEIDRLVFQ